MKRCDLWMHRKWIVFRQNSFSVTCWINCTRMTTSWIFQWTKPWVSNIIARSERLRPWETDQTILYFHLVQIHLFSELHVYEWVSFCSNKWWVVKIHVYTAICLQPATQRTLQWQHTHTHTQQTDITIQAVNMLSRRDAVPHNLSISLPGMEPPTFLSTLSTTWTTATTGRQIRQHNIWRNWMQISYLHLKSQGFADLLRGMKNDPVWLKVCIVRSNNVLRGLKKHFEKKGSQDKGSIMRNHEAQQQALKWNWHPCRWEPTYVSLWCSCSHIQFFQASLASVPVSFNFYPHLSFCPICSLKGLPRGGG